MTLGKSDTQGVDSAKPFLRWAGGKRWLVQHIAEVAPRDFNRYFEPFLGSGALFFALRPPRAVLSDTNCELITAFKMVRDNPEEVIRQLKSFEYTSNEYYVIRAATPRDELGRAVRLIYLNRTAWNGLYRVNSRGGFNVPFGRKGTLADCDADRIRQASFVLKNTTLRCTDFEMALAEADSEDFVFIDPPYTVTHKDNGFILYNEEIFSWEDQSRLARVAADLSRKGVLVMITNASHPSLRELYHGFSFHVLNRSSILAADPKNRKRVSELLITNYRLI